MADFPITPSTGGLLLELGIASKAPTTAALAFTGSSPNILGLSKSLSPFSGGITSTALAPGVLKANFATPSTGGLAIVGGGPGAQITPATGSLAATAVAVFRFTRPGGVRRGRRTPAGTDPTIARLVGTKHEHCLARNH